MTRKWGEHPNDGNGLLRVSKMLSDDKPAPVLTKNVLPESHYRALSYDQLVQMCQTADTANWQAREEVERMRGNLSLAEDGLAAATQEIELVRAQRDSNLAKEVETVSRLEAEIGVLQSRLEGSQAAAAVGEREIEQLKRNLAWQSQEIDAQVGEIARLREVLTIPNITPDTTSPALFIRTLSEHEKGLPVNTQDLVNALMWRVKNQRKEISRLHEQRTSAEPRVGHDEADAADRKFGVEDGYKPGWTEDECEHGIPVNSPSACPGCHAVKSSESPPVDNAHVAEGCEKFDE